MNALLHLPSRCDLSHGIRVYLVVLQTIPNTCWIFFIPGGSMRTAKELMWLAVFDYAIMAAIAIGVIKLVLSYR